MLLSMCSCAPGYFSVELFSICRVITLGKKMQISTCVAINSKVFDLESRNFTGMWLSICKCAPGYFAWIYSVVVVAWIYSVVEELLHLT
jgi:hypothetical protein